MSEEQPRNAQAGQRQKQVAKEQRQESGSAFAKYGLTRKNEEFIYQLSKQLNRQGVAKEKQPAMIQETINKLLEGQKKGQTAKALLGTPTAYANELKHPKPTSEAVRKESFKLLAVDNTLIFFSIFTFMYGLMYVLSPAAFKFNRNGSAGITAILLVAIIGGLLFSYVLLQIRPQAKKKRPLIWRILIIVIALVAWLLLYMLASMLPNAINPVLNGWLYIVFGVAGFGGDVYFRNHFHVMGLYGRRQRRR